MGLYGTLRWVLYVFLSVIPTSDGPWQDRQEAIVTSLVTSLRQHLHYTPHKIDRRVVTWTSFLAWLPNITAAVKHAGRIIPGTYFAIRERVVAAWAQGHWSSLAFSDCSLNKDFKSVLDKFVEGEVARWYWKLWFPAGHHALCEFLFFY